MDDREKHSINVTDIIKKNKTTNIVSVNPNQLFGDPYPGQAKKLYITLKKNTNP